MPLAKYDAGAKDMGSWFLPRVGDHVWVVFEKGDPDAPRWVAVDYNLDDMPPPWVDLEVRGIRCPDGLEIVFARFSGYVDDIAQVLSKPGDIRLGQLALAADSGEVINSSRHPPQQVQLVLFGPFFAEPVLVLADSFINAVIPFAPDFHDV